MVNCGACGNSAPVCTSNVWGPCTSTAQCSNGLACISGSCQACSSHDQCGTNQICNGGTYYACTVCSSGCAHTTVNSAAGAATAGDTIAICPGTYNGGIEITKNMTLIGAGSELDGTILRGANESLVVSVNSAEVALRDLQVTGRISRLRVVAASGTGRDRR